MVVLIGLLLTISTMVKVIGLVSSIIYAQSPLELLDITSIIGIAIGALFWIILTIYTYKNTAIDDLVIPTGIKTITYIIKLIGLALTPSLIAVILLMETVLVVTALTNYLYYVVGGYIK